MALLAHQPTGFSLSSTPTNDKGSYDQDMTSERLARIREAEEEASCAVLGIPKENLIWLGHHDGELEYLPAEDALRPGSKSSGNIARTRSSQLIPVNGTRAGTRPITRIAAFNTLDAVRTAEFRLYYPEHLLVDKLQPYVVPNMYLFYTTANEPITSSTMCHLRVEAGGRFQAGEPIRAGHDEVSPRLGPQRSPPPQGRISQGPPEEGQALRGLLPLRYRVQPKVATDYGVAEAVSAVARNLSASEPSSRISCRRFFMSPKCANGLSISSKFAPAPRRSPDIAAHSVACGCSGTTPRPTRRLLPADPCPPAP